MSLKKTITQKVQEYSDYQKKHNFFVVDRSATAPQKSMANREDDWNQLCDTLHLPLTSSVREKDDMQGEAIVMKFSNGLSIVDTGYHVSFNATVDKSKVDLDSALSVIKCAANHLYRETGAEPEISTNREGSYEMTKAFKESCTKARKIVNDSEIARLAAQKIR